MDLTFVTECRFYRTKENKFYTDDISYSNKLWQRYLQSFERVYVVARIFESEQEFSDELLVDNVTFCPVFPFENIVGFFLNFSHIKRQLRTYVLDSNRVKLFRGPGTLGTLAAEICISNNVCFNFEVVGDPDDVFAPGVIKHPLRPLLRMFYVRSLKRQAKKANAIIYVTKHTLQKKYPASKATYCEYASDVFLESDKLAKVPKQLQGKKSYKLLSIGSLNQMYKSPDIVIESVAKLRQKGVECQLTWLGDGKYLQPMKSLAESLGVSEHIYFLGAVTSDEVTVQLDNADIFILASRTEGLPRAMVEAMARGLPCIGTRVGGIPELLDSEALIPKESIDALTLKLEQVITDTEFANKLAAINLENAHEYSFEKLDKRRMDFYEYLKKTKDF